MAHNLDITDGVASFVSAHTDAWHHLGEVNLEGAMTAEVALAKAKLANWNVRKAPVEAVVGDQRILIPGMSAVVRDNPVRKGQIDVLSKHNVSGTTDDEGFRIIQNEQHTGILDALVEESGAHFETAGALYGGSQVFVTMKLPGHINIGGVDPVENYLAAINSHDGSMSFKLMVTPVRIVCANTLNLAFQNKSHTFSVRHTSGAEKQLRLKAREALDMSFNYLDAFQEEAEKLINTTMTQAQFEAIIEREFGAGADAGKAAITRAENKLEVMGELFADASTQSGIRDTAWAGFNALTEYADHFSATRGDDHDTSRAVKALFDTEFKDRALKLMLAQV